MIAEEIITIDQVPKDLWIQTADIDEFEKSKEDLFDILRANGGDTQIVIFSRKERAIKRLPTYESVHVTDSVLEQLSALYGQGNVRLAEKIIEKRRKKR